jgi:hypothetical protein
MQRRQGHGASAEQSTWFPLVATFVVAVSTVLVVAALSGCEAGDGAALEPGANVMPICLTEPARCGEVGFTVEQVIGDGAPEPMVGAELEFMDASMRVVATHATGPEGYVRFAVAAGPYTVGVRTGDCGPGRQVRPCVRRLVPENVQPQRSQEENIRVKYTNCHPLDPECIELDFDRVIKPNVYLYPEEEQAVSVRLTPLAPGALTITIPEYGDGWDVTAAPDGLIDGQYGFLFYEADIVPQYQTDEGWAVSFEELRDWMEEILPQYGLNEQEVVDFVDYWTAHLPPFPYYLFFPQDEAICDRLVALQVDPAPDRVLRIWFHIVGAYGRFALPEPAIAPFERAGFTVTEWGILVNDFSFGLE